MDISKYFKILSLAVFRCCGAYAAQIDLTFDLQIVYINIEKAIPFGLNLYELIGNCIKHAFKDAPSKTIWVSLKASDRVVLTVADSGPGVPYTVEFHKTQTLDLKLVNTLTKQLYGGLNWLAHGVPNSASIFRLTIRPNEAPSHPRGNRKQC